ncbi:hypothetical protein RQP46_000908 [Phenoliferia psychrophenolica]
MNDMFAGRGVVFTLAGTDVTENKSWFEEAYNMGSPDFKDHPSTQAEIAMKKALRKGTESDCNVYTVGFEKRPEGTQSLLGYATLPRGYTANPSNDGVVMTFKSIKGPAAKIDRDTTLGHEVGHWMGLDHTWGGGATKDADGNDASLFNPFHPSPVIADLPFFPQINGCSANNGDFVDDTPDYSSDRCQTHFTPGQGDRMIAQAAEYRNIK